MTTETRLQTLLDRLIGKGNIFNVVASVQSKDGKIDWAGAAGTADPTTGAAMSPDTPYALASITKMYTATVILRLHEQGRLSLDEPISKYLPGTLIDGIHVYQGHDYSREIKVFQLLSHTTGIGDYFEDKPQGGHSVFEELKQGHDLDLDIQRVVTIVRGLTPHFEPGARGGTKARYADTNFRLLGAIIEAITGQPMTTCFEQMIFDPLGLDCTYVYGSTRAQTKTPSAAIFLKANAVSIPKFFASNIPDGGLVSTARNNLVFLRAFFEGKLFDAKRFERMMARWNRIFFPMQYGYGMMRFKMPWFFWPFNPPPEFVGHSGSTGSFGYYCPSKGLYLAGSVNQIAAPVAPIMLMMRIANTIR